MILPNDWRDVPLFVKAKPHIMDVETVIDVGPGLRPQSLVTCRNHICVEPHGEYADALDAAGFSVLRDAAPGALKFFDVPVDTIVMLDVIEHMEKADGLDAIRLACSRSLKQVIVFTPLGFMEQSGGDGADAWGMQGQEWQRHRSGWTPDDFPGWLHLVDEHPAPGHPAFIAILSK